MRDILTRFDFCSYLVVGVLAYVLVRRAGQFLPRFAGAMWWAGIVVLLGITVYGYIEVRPAKPFEIFGLAMVAGIAACAAGLATAVILVPLTWVFGRCTEVIENRRTAVRLRTELLLQAEQERRLADQQEQARRERAQAKEEYRRSLPPPLTREDRALAAKRRYEETLRLLEGANLDELEQKAARDQAKQKYLRDIDGLVE